MKKMLDINTDAVAKFANQLEKVGRNALPVAVRQTLTSTSYDAKQRTIIQQADKTFDKRQANFFKANSNVEQAQGLNINDMQSTVGFIESGLKGGNNYAVKDLQQQEFGGAIGGRAFIPLKQARVSSSWNKNVRANARIGQIKNKIIDSNDVKGKNDKEKFIKSAVHAGKGGWVIGNRTNGKGNKTMFQVRSIIRKNRDTIVKATPMYSVDGGRQVKPKATHFMQKACEQSAAQMEQFFIKHATKQLAKYK